MEQDARIPGGRKAVGCTNWCTRLLDLPAKSNGLASSRVVFWNLRAELHEVSDLGHANITTTSRCLTFAMLRLERALSLLQESERHEFGGDEGETEEEVRNECHTGATGSGFNRRRRSVRRTQCVMNPH